MIVIHIPTYKTFIIKVLYVSTCITICIMYWTPPPLEFFIFLLYPWKFQTIQSSTPGYSTKLSYISWKFQGQKQRPLEIPHLFFLVTLGNSTSFLIKAWKSHILFPWYPWKFDVLNLPSLISFLDEPITAAVPQF